jgi:hypothetical protein
MLYNPNDFITFAATHYITKTSTNKMSGAPKSALQIDYYPCGLSTSYNFQPKLCFRSTWKVQSEMMPTWKVEENCSQECIFYVKSSGEILTIF